MPAEPGEPGAGVARRHRVTHRTAYRYLPASVANFPDAPELARRLEGAGFVGVGYRALTLGVVAVHWGERAA